MEMCPSCGNEKLISRSDARLFHPPGVSEPVLVTMWSSVCSDCGAKVTTSQQRRNNLQALAARKSFYGEWLMGEEIVQLRKKYGITQQQASEIFGKGKVAFSRYETEASFPDLTMSKMMALALRDASVMAQLATMAGVKLPLLEKRLVEMFVRALSTEGSLNKLGVDTPTGTLIGANSSMSGINAFISSLRRSVPHTHQSGMRMEDDAVSAANDERFALAA